MKEDNVYENLKEPQIWENVLISHQIENAYFHATHILNQKNLEIPETTTRREKRQFHFL